MRKRPASTEFWQDLAGPAEYSARKLAQLRNRSLRQIEREFQRTFGRAPQDWLNERRLLAARELLLAGEPVKNVASALGFKQTSHFCRQFKSLNRMTPSEFASLTLSLTGNVARR